jgi:hypothetical protein
MPWQDVKEAHNVLGIKDGDAEWASKKMAPAKKNDTVTEPRADLIAEHERLVGVLESPSHADDKVEAKKQAKELGEMKGEGGDVVDPFTLSKNELNKRLDAMVAAGEAYDSIRAFLELRKRYVRATGKPSIPPMGSRAIRINPEDLTG